MVRVGLAKGGSGNPYRLSKEGFRLFRPVGALEQLHKGDGVHGFNRYTYANINPYKYIDPDGLISIDGSHPNVRKLRAEICGIPKVPNLTGKIQLMSKKQMKKEFDRASPNMADCFAMAMEIPEDAQAKIKIEFEGWE